MPIARQPPTTPPPWKHGSRPPRLPLPPTMLARFTGKSTCAVVGAGLAGCVSLRMATTGLSALTAMVIEEPDDEEEPAPPKRAKKVPRKK